MSPRWKCHCFSLLPFLKCSPVLLVVKGRGTHWRIMSQSFLRSKDRKKIEEQPTKYVLSPHDSISVQTPMRDTAVLRDY